LLVSLSGSRFCGCSLVFSRFYGLQEGRGYPITRSGSENGKREEALPLLSKSRMSAVAGVSD
jgi:hypothetical protein